MATLICTAFTARVAPAVTVDWTVIGDSGNACDVQAEGCFGGVAYDYAIGAVEVTNAQYAEFLNAVADADPHALYHGNMGSGVGGITRSGSSGSYDYGTIAGRERMPVGSVSLYDAMRFANWLHNGQPDTGAQTAATTEDGSYTFSGSTTVGPRNPSATVVLPNEDEWFKAAYYDPLAASYFEFPTSSDAVPACSVPAPASNAANCAFAVNDFRSVGSYPNAPSPYGTFDQGGNAFERSETPVSGGFFLVRGGGFDNTVGFLRASNRDFIGPNAHAPSVGFRVAMLPEPGVALSLLAGAALLGLLRRR